MSFPGHLYGAVLNDKVERASLASEFASPPYGTPPAAPVVYMKPRTAVSRGSTKVDPGESLRAASTLALLFARDTARCDPGNAMDHVGAMCLALDICLPQVNYYRPATGQAIRDGFLVLGDWMPPAPVAEITTLIDGVPGHRWCLDRLVRAPGQLIADLSAFMTLRAGDVLLIGLPGDAPSVRGGQAVTLQCACLPSLHASFEESVS